MKLENILNPRKLTLEKILMKILIGMDVKFTLSLSLNTRRA